MTALDVAAFRERLLREGYDVAEGGIDPNVSRPEHAHPFAVEALVTSGAITLTCGGAARVYRVGEQFTMAVGAPHAEATGADGVRYVVGKRG